MQWFGPGASYASRSVKTWGKTYHTTRLSKQDNWDLLQDWVALTMRCHICQFCDRGKLSNLFGERGSALLDVLRYSLCRWTDNKHFALCLIYKQRVSGSGRKKISRHLSHVLKNASIIPIHLSVRRYIHPSNMFIHYPSNPSIYPSIYSSIYSSIYLYINPFTHSSIYSCIDIPWVHLRTSVCRSHQL